VALAEELAGCFVKPGQAQYSVLAVEPELSRQEGQKPAYSAKMTLVVAQ
tara:strand:+ start:1158 stop:1304 length:147 start_codon:yes stop_codon:yes gene_type:complete